MDILFPIIKERIYIIFQMIKEILDILFQMPKTNLYIKFQMRKKISDILYQIIMEIIKQKIL